MHFILGGIPIDRLASSDLQALPLQAQEGRAVMISDKEQIALLQNECRHLETQLAEAKEEARHLANNKETWRLRSEMLEKKLAERDGLLEKMAEALNLNIEDECNMAGFNGFCHCHKLAVKAKEAISLYHSTKKEGHGCDTRCRMHKHEGHICDCNCVCHSKPQPGGGQND